MKNKKRKNIGRIALGVIKKFVPKVTKVSDADSDLLISVTDRDFKEGKKKDHADCALAIAAKRQEHATSVIVSSSIAYVIKGNHAIRYKVPESGRKEIVSFDRGSEFASGDYKLKAPGKSMRLGTQHETSASGSKTGSMAKRFVHYTANIRHSLKKEA